MPEACTLPTAEQPLRAAEFDALFATALLDLDRREPGHVRLVLDRVAEERARTLAQSETGCCSFFTFTFHGGEAERLLMDISAPAEHAAVVEALAVRAETARAG
ncbi:hypothetical protein ACFQ6S_15900 [Streptomyces sp. NPDC056479]|uniref:hypothetical protein n=1 Tax=Streptomyces sp. NPDC056479 TaxID=3345832 RepID=UPI0036CCFD5B